mgnify:CR=1 FL=1
MDADYAEQMDTLVARYKEAEGPLMKLANYAGSQIEGIFSTLPEGFESQIQSIVKRALDTAYEASGTISASRLAPTTPSYFHKLAVTVSGAVGGVAGLPGAMAELPVTITTMFSSFQKIAEEYGFDPKVQETKLECIKIFSMGGPLEKDEDIDLSFVSARLGLQGEFVSQLISKATQKLALVISQKLGSQSVPIIGAVTGATLNYTFMSYYEEMAHVRFGLKRLQNEYPESQPLEEFIELYEAA